MAGSDALVASLSLNSALALLFCGVFSVLRPWFPAVYSPRASCDPPPPALPRGIFAWLRPLLALEERPIFGTAGLDVVMHLRFLRLSFQLFAAATVTGCGGLVPLMLLYSRSSDPQVPSNSSWVDVISITNLPNSSSLFWGHVSFMYFFTVLGLALLHLNYKDYAVLRWEALASGAAHRCWVLVREIPDDYANEAKMETFFREMYPDSLAHITMARDTSLLDPIMDMRQTALTNLEVALHKNLRTGERPKERHFTSEGWGICERLGLQCILGAKVDSIDWHEAQLNRLNKQVLSSVDHALSDPHFPRHIGSDRCTARAEAMAVAEDGRAARAVQKATDGVEAAAEGMVEVVVGGASGVIVDGAEGAVSGAVHGGRAGGVGGALGGALQGGAVGALTGALHGGASSGVNASKGDEAVSTRLLPCAFVGFKHVRCAIQACRVQHARDATTFQVSPCPEPRDVIWKNLGISDRSRLVRRAAVSLGVFWLIFFWMVPVGFVASLSNLRNLESVFPFIRPALLLSPALSAILEGFLPSLALAVFMNQLPVLLHLLAVLEGAHAWSSVVTSTLDRFFWFQLINVFLGVTFSAGGASGHGTCLAAQGGAFEPPLRACLRLLTCLCALSVLQQVLDRPAAAPAILGSSIPAAASFFVNYLALQAFSTFPLQLLQPDFLLLRALRMSFAQTARQKQAAGASPAYNFGSEAPKQLLVLTVGSVYSVINPVVLPLAAVYFGAGLVVVKYKLVFVHATEHQADGGMWPKLVSRIVLALVLLHLTVIGLFSLKEAPYQGASLIPLPLACLAALRYWTLVFRRPAQHLPISLCPAAPQPAAGTPGRHDGAGLEERVESEAGTEEGAPVPAVERLDASVGAIDAVLSALDASFSTDGQTDEARRGEPGPEGRPDASDVGSGGKMMEACAVKGGGGATLFLAPALSVPWLQVDPSLASAYRSACGGVPQAQAGRHEPERDQEQEHGRGQEPEHETASGRRPRPREDGSTANEGPLEQRQGGPRPSPAPLQAPADGTRAGRLPGEGGEAGGGGGGGEVREPPELQASAAVARLERSGSGAAPRYPV